MRVPRRACPSAIAEAESLAEVVERAIGLGVSGPQALERAELGRVELAQVEVQVFVPEQELQGLPADGRGVEQAVDADPPRPWNIRRSTSWPVPG